MLEMRTSVVGGSRASASLSGGSAPSWASHLLNQAIYLTVCVSSLGVFVRCPPQTVASASCPRSDGSPRRSSAEGALKRAWAHPAQLNRSVGPHAYSTGWRDCPQFRRLDLPCVTEVGKKYLSAQHARLVKRRGMGRAQVAVAHSILVSAYHMLKNDEPYQDLGADWLAARHSDEAHARRLVAQLERLGHTVILDPAA